MEPKQPSFWAQKFDILLLSAFVLLFAVHAIYGIGDGYAQRTSDLFSGALLGLLTGKQIASRINSTPPATPPEKDIDPHDESH